jgi:hypothetical protein
MGTMAKNGTLLCCGMLSPTSALATGARASMKMPGRMPARRQRLARKNIAASE